MCLCVSRTIIVLNEKSTLLGIRNVPYAIVFCIVGMCLGTWKMNGRVVRFSQYVRIRRSAWKKKQHVYRPVSSSIFRRRARLYAFDVRTRKFGKYRAASGLSAFWYFHTDLVGLIAGRADQMSDRVASNLFRGGSLRGYTRSTTQVQNTDVRRKLTQECPHNTWECPRSWTFDSSNAARESFARE